MCQHPLMPYIPAGASASERLDHGRLSGIGRVNYWIMAEKVGLGEWTIGSWQTKWDWANYWIMADKVGLGE
jgi:hypothetical protein